MRIVTFNVRHGRLPSGSADTAALARYCASLRADVLALQEVDQRVARSGRRDQCAEVAAAAGLRSRFGPARRLGVRGRYGNALLVRGELDEVEDLALPRLSRKEPRGALVATAVIDGRRLSVAATHLSTDADEAPVQLAAVLSALDARPSPRVLLGDFNLAADRVAAVLEGRGLTLADPALPTFPASAPRHRIDHVAVEGLEVLAVEVMAAALVSDHRALAVEVG